MPTGAAACNAVDVLSASWYAGCMSAPQGNISPAAEGMQGELKPP